MPSKAGVLAGMGSCLGACSNTLRTSNMLPLTVPVRHCRSCSSSRRGRILACRGPKYQDAKLAAGLLGLPRTFAGANWGQESSKEAKVRLCKMQWRLAFKLPASTLASTLGAELTRAVVLAIYPQYICTRGKSACKSGPQELEALGHYCIWHAHM